MSLSVSSSPISSPQLVSLREFASVGLSELLLLWLMEFVVVVAVVVV